MKYVLNVLLICIMMYISGCGAETTAAAGGFVAGAATAMELAKQKTEEVNKLVQEADTTSTALNKVLSDAKQVIDSKDADKAAAMLEVISKESPSDVNKIIANGIEAYNNVNGFVATTKQKAKDPGYWLALLMTLTAAYQKYQRGRESIIK